MEKEEPKLTRKQRLWVDAYFGASLGNAADAARYAGYKNPRVSGSLLKRQLAPLLKEREEELRSKSALTPEECLSLLRQIAYDVHHKDRLRAIELSLKVHGLLSDKLEIRTDRSVMLREAREALELLKVQVIDSPNVRQLTEDSSQVT